MHSKTLRLVTLLLVSGSTLASAAPSVELKDPYFGEALYYAYQQRHFDAISRLDAELAQYHGVDEPKLNSLNFHINQAEFSVGDFELGYRMHQRAGRAISAVIEGNVPAAVRNEAIYRLSRLLFQTQDYVNALHTIERIKGELPPGMENTIAFLKGQIYLANGRFSDAEDIFAALEGKSGYQGFAAYNRAISLFAQEQYAKGAEAMDRAGSVSGNERETEAIRDKANLVLGSRLLEKGEAQLAGKYLERVRLDGPFSNRALLGAGWADIKREDYKHALVPWSLLFKRNATDPSVQQALLGVPYAYAQLGLYGKSALLYGSALEKIGGELDRLDASIDSIRQGRFLQALGRQEGREDKEWVIRLRELPQAPETFYLMELMASNDFQTMLQNYLDLDDLRLRLASWSTDYTAYNDIIELRRRYYEPLLPSIDAQFRKLDSVIRLRMEQRERLDKKLKKMLIAPQPEFLATAQERMAKERITAMEQSIKGKRVDAGTLHRIARLKGAILWNITTNYQARLTEAFEHLAALDKDIAVLQETYAAFVRTRQAATQSYQGYDEPIRRLGLKTDNALATVNTLMARQGHLLEVMAVNELVRRRQKLEEYQMQARFALAENYDRASKAKSQEETSRLDAQQKDSAAKVPPTEPPAAQQAPAKAQETK
ncbi:MAG: tetratricopeptide repeat protein [Sideroxyarcus sp.]